MSSQQYTECPNCKRNNSPNATYCSRCGASMDGEVDPLLGKHVGKYVMTKRVGAGGSGTVYLGVHADLGRQVAIKVLRSNLITDEESKARFEREARVLAGLVHDNIVTIIDIGYLPGIGPYMVMEWLEGFTLFEARRQRKYLELFEVVPLFNQLTSAISYMHKQSVIHRDLKPENMILVGRDGDSSIADVSSHVMKLYDFGIALFTAGDERKLTAAGLVVGTPHYMAPEQIIINAPVTYRADLYALGCILFELIVGHPPFWGAKRPIDIMGRHINEDPKPLHELVNGRDLPPGLQAVMDRALAKKPAERYQDAREMFDALQAAAAPPSPIVVHETQPFSLHDVNDKTVVQSADLWNLADIQAHLNPNPAANAPMQQGPPPPPSQGPPPPPSQGPPPPPPQGSADPFDNMTLADPRPAPPRGSVPQPMAPAPPPVSMPSSAPQDVWPPPAADPLDELEDIRTQNVAGRKGSPAGLRWAALAFFVLTVLSFVGYMIYRFL